MTCDKFEVWSEREGLGGATTLEAAVWHVGNISGEIFSRNRGINTIALVNKFVSDLQAEV
jgi:hypothetical protein